MTENQPVHIPVLHAALPGEDSPVLRLLNVKTGDAVLDVTLGLGGHAEAFLQATSPDGHYTGLDADEENLESSRKRLQPFGSRVTLIHTNFSQLPFLNLQPVDVLFADLGLSSPHLDDGKRGFSFRTDAPLDLRFDRSAGQTGAEFLSAGTVHEIATVLRDYGEVDRPGKLAEELHQAFSAGASTTTDVKTVVEAVYGHRAPSLLPQVFQAIRIAVNDEIGALTTLLRQLPNLLKPGGRAGIISYHSLEDRLVKDAFRTLATTERDPLTGADLRPADFEILTRRPVTPDTGEIARNPRSRSAKFRVLRKRP